MARPASKWKTKTLTIKVDMNMDMYMDTFYFKNKMNNDENKTARKEQHLRIDRKSDFRATIIYPITNNLYGLYRMLKWGGVFSGVFILVLLVNDIYSFICPNQLPHSIFPIRKYFIKKKGSRK